MIYLETRIDIDTSPAHVFALLCDTRRRLELNPEFEVLDIETLTAGPLAEGTRVYQRIRCGKDLTSVTTEVVRFVPGRVLELVGETHARFRIRLTVDPAEQGCQLLHQEWLDMDRPRVQTAAENRPSLFLIRILQRATGFGPLSFEQADDAHQEILAESLRGSLDAWLQNIKLHLESGPTSLATDQWAVAAHRS